MKVYARQLNDLISGYAVKLKTLNEENSSLPPAPGKWSKKEELGHLIDSATHNLRRFIAAQYEYQPKIVYDQDNWVRINHYNTQQVLQLSRLWLLLNQQIANILDHMPAEMAERTCDTGKEEVQLRTLEWLAGDYMEHLRHHMQHLLDEKL